MDLLKNPRAFLRFHHFLGFLGIFLYRKKSWIGYVDHGRLSVHGGFTTMGRRGRSGAQEVIVIARRERERERGRCRGSHQCRQLEPELWRWPHNRAQQRRPVVLRLGDGSGREEILEPRWVQWIMGVLSTHLL
jgi:hypothetical protein